MARADSPSRPRIGLALAGGGLSGAARRKVVKVRNGPPPA
jgi:predicted acylesterase/phospholipase RssA